MANVDATVAAHDWHHQATNISLQARSSLLEPNTGYLELLAVGGGPLGNKGEVWIQGTELTTIGTGSAYLTVESPSVTESHVSVVNGLPGSIVLSQSSMPGGPNLVLDASPAPKISLGLGLDAMPSKLAMDMTTVELCTGTGPTGSSLAMKPDGLTLQYGNYSLKMGPLGITLSVGPNSLSLTNEGIALNGLTLDLSAKTIMKTKAMVHQDESTLVKVG